MSKRKAKELQTSSGESSDGVVEDAPAAKKPSAPYAPVRMSVQPSRPFQHPNRAGSPLARINNVTPSSRSKSKHAVPPHVKLPMPKPTPSLGKDSGASSDEGSHEMRPLPSLGKKASDRTKDVPVTLTTNADPLARSRVTLEKRLNDIADTLEEHRTHNEERDRQNEERHAAINEYHERTDKKLDHILDAITALTLQMNARPTKDVDNSDRELSTRRDDPSADFILRNPPVPAGMVDLVKRIVKNKVQRAERKKNEPVPEEENSIKDHACQNLYGVLGGIKQSKDIPPPFFDENGMPDIFPRFAIDPETGYCQPYPNWTAPLSDQVEWVPTYLERFRKTIPNNESALSKVLQRLSDEDIIAYMHDGPFSTARSYWRKLAKSDEALKEMQSEVRQRWRLDRIVAVRRAYCKEVPSLQGPQYSWVFHRDAMSPQVSDTEGDIITYNPQWRASWVRDLWDSVDSAELQKAMKKRGLCPRPRPPNFQEGSSDLPQLTKTAVNGREVPVVIAYSGLKNVWRRANRELMDSSPHLIDKDLKVAPSIQDFVDKYPPIDYEESDGESEEQPDTVADGHLRGEPDVSKGLGGAVFDEDDGGAADDEQDEEPGGPWGTVATGGWGKEPVPGDDMQVAADLIDPNLRGVAETITRPRPKMRVLPEEQPGAETCAETIEPTLHREAAAPAATGSPSADLDESDPPPTAFPPPHTASHLPRPPSLRRQAQAAADLAATQVPAEEPVAKKRAKKGAAPVAGSSGQAGGELTMSQGVETTAGEKAQPKKRGRPPGSKNKKKLQE